MDCCQRSPVAPFTVTWMIPTYGEESVKSGSEASGFLVVPLVFKTRERRAASLAGSIPVRLRHQRRCRCAPHQRVCSCLADADAGGDTRLAVDQPSLLFASYGDPRIAYVGHELDALLARLIILLGGGLPLQLAAVYASGNDDA
jgi:hypothetical protein